MLIEKHQIDAHNAQQYAKHKKRLDFLTSEIEGERAILQKLIDFQIAIPSWALGRVALVLVAFQTVVNRAIWRKKSKMWA